MFRAVLESADFSVSSILKSIRYNNINQQFQCQQVPMSCSNFTQNFSQNFTQNFSQNCCPTSKFIFQKLYSDILILTPKVSGEEYLNLQKDNPTLEHKNVPKSCDMFIALENQVIFCHSVVILAFSGDTIREFCEKMKEDNDYRYFPMDFKAGGFTFQETWLMVKYFYTGKAVMASECFEKFSRLIEAMVPEIMDPVGENGRSIVKRKNKKTQGEK